jgi:hypothetical protein
MIAPADLDLAPARDGAAGVDHEPARRDVEDAGIAPGSSVAEPRRHDDAAAKLARLLRS